MTKLVQVSIGKGVGVCLSDWKQRSKDLLGLLDLLTAQEHEQQWALASHVVASIVHGQLAPQRNGVAGEEVDSSRLGEVAREVNGGVKVAVQGELGARGAISQAHKADLVAELVGNIGKDLEIFGALTNSKLDSCKMGEKKNNPVGANKPSESEAREVTAVSGFFSRKAAKSACFNSVTAGPAWPESQRLMAAAERSPS